MAQAKTTEDSDLVLDIRGLVVSFATNDGEVRAVRGIDLAVRKGETVAVVGESGSGKSQSFMAAMGLLPPNGRAMFAARWQIIVCTLDPRWRVLPMVSLGQCACQHVSVSTRRW